MLPYEDTSSALARRLGAQVNSRRLANKAAALWRRIDMILSPLFGRSLVALLYEKSLSEAKVTHSWLPADPQPPDEPPVMDLARLKLVLTRQSPSAALAGASLMLQNFCLLLEELVGPGLASRILQSVFAPRNSRPTSSS